MKISDLEKLLKEYREFHGDLEISFSKKIGNIVEVECVFKLEKDNTYNYLDFIVI